MTLPNTYSCKEKIDLLSKKLKYLTKQPNSYKDHVDYQIKTENLLYNVSLILSHIILKFKFVDRSKSVFVEIIQGYNTKNNTNLTFDNYESICWVRTINDEIIIPETIRHYIWEVGNNEQQGKPIDIHDGKSDLVRCLQIFYQRCYYDPKIIIKKDDLEDVLKKLSSSIVDIDFLIEHKILEFNSIDNSYFWSAHEYKRYLRNEIASILWLLMCEGKDDENEFRKYLRYLNALEIWPDNLDNYLSHENTSKICAYSVLLLNKELDLNNSVLEFNKIWLDSPRFSYVTIKSEVPFVILKSTTPLKLIEEIEYYKFRFEDSIDHQESRSIYELLLRFILQFDVSDSNPYQNTISLLNNIEKPFLVWSTYKQIGKYFPEVIPYLISNTDLTPIAYRLIDQIEINQVFLPYNEIKTDELKAKLEFINEIWIELFEITLDQISLISSVSLEIGETLGYVLSNLADGVFSFDPFNRNSTISHQSNKKRYDETFKILNEKRTVSSTNSNQRLIPLIIIDVFNYLKNKRTFLPHNEYLKIELARFDIANKLLKSINLFYSDSLMPQEQKGKLSILKDDILTLLRSQIETYYSVNETDIQTYSQDTVEKREIVRGVNDFGFEMIDWGYMYLHFQQKDLISAINSKFESVICFDIHNGEGIYAKQNKEQFEKIRTYLKSLLLAYHDIQRNKDSYERIELPVNATLNKLETLIEQLALKYSTDDIKKSQIDVFKEEFGFSYNNIYSQTMSSLLYKTINLFSNINRKKFISDLFSKSIDLGKMLSAINILDSKDLKDTISTRIFEVDIKEYIASRYSVTELESALIESINTESHWQQFTEPLMKKIQEHFSRTRPNNDNSQNLFFEVNLLLAFKLGEFQKLIKIEVPKLANGIRSHNPKGENRKNFYIAIFKLYNEKKYDEAIQKLNSLQSLENKNIYYAFHLYKAKILKALTSNDNILLNQAYQEWSEFINSLNEEERKSTESLIEPVAMNNLHFYAALKDYTNFDLTFNRLSAKYLYDEELIPTIFHCFLERGLHELAFDYLPKSALFYKENGLLEPKIIKSLKDKYPDEPTIKSLKLILGNLPSQRVTDIPRILPNRINGETNLNNFILNEIIKASRVMVEKIEAIRDIKGENRYNDLLLAILRLRLPIWGWAIQDQPRTGTSAMGKDAGLADHFIQAGGDNIALFEAFILRDKVYTEKHILKCEEYARSLDRFYVIIYNINAKVNFDNDWLLYQKHVLDISYPLDFVVDSVSGFEDLSTKFTDINHLKVAKTIHNEKIAMFHIMINLGK